MPPLKQFFFSWQTPTRGTHTHTHTHTATCQFNFLIKHAFNFKSARRGQSTQYTPFQPPSTPYGTARLPKTASSLATRRRRRRRHRKLISSIPEALSSAFLIWRRFPVPPAPLPPPAFSMPRKGLEFVSCVCVDRYFNFIFFHFRNIPFSIFSFSVLRGISFQLWLWLLAFSHLPL